MRRCLIILALAGCEHWTKQDTALEVAFAGATALDWRQTVSITGNCEESNPMIGRCGGMVPPNIYFPIAIAVHAAIAACLPRRWRTVFQAFTTGLEVGTVASNDQHGYEML
jgi:hypothetical protein